jgi:hypothetical protein
MMPGSSSAPGPRLQRLLRRLTSQLCRCAKYPASCRHLVIEVGRFIRVARLQVLPLPPEQFQFVPILQFGTEVILSHLREFLIPMGHMSRAMLERYSHIRMAAKRVAVAGIPFARRKNTPRQSLLTSHQQFNSSKIIDFTGERGRNRTYNLVIKSHLLCQLSYAPLEE